MANLRILVYSGKGSSHSWTWLARLFEARGVFDARFVDEVELAELVSSGPHLVIVSGGDGFEMASHMSGRCFKELKEYLARGGTYVGMCAGAYLPLPSRVDPFRDFNLSTTRIRNIMHDDGSNALESPRLAVRYGSCCIYHPVRGDVMVDSDGVSYVAPLYGGPVFSEPTEDRVILRYLSFTDNTQVQFDRESAKKTVIGSPAAIVSSVGEGEMVLLGPHLEHPGYPEANDAFLRLCKLDGHGAVGGPRSAQPRRSMEIERSIADFKVAVLGMEHETFVVGSKVWDGSRLLELLDAIEGRYHSLDADSERQVMELLDKARNELSSIGPEKIGEAEAAPGDLVHAARLCVNGHFSIMNG